MSGSAHDGDDFMEVDVPDLAITDVLIITVNVSYHGRLSGLPS